MREYKDSQLSKSAWDVKHTDRRQKKHKKVTWKDTSINIFRRIREGIEFKKKRKESFTSTWFLKGQLEYKKSFWKLKNDSKN